MDEEVTGDRILITGSRTWKNRALMEARLGPWFSFDNVLVSGHCKTGGDKMAEEIWAGWLGFSVSAAIFGGYIEIHPADWTGPCRDSCRRNHRRPRYGSSSCPAAGDYRNLDMIDLGAAKCLAFACMCEIKGCRDEMAKANKLPPYTHGTLHCGIHALKAGIDTEWIPEGMIKGSKKGLYHDRTRPHRRGRERPRRHHLQLPGFHLGVIMTALDRIVETETDVSLFIFQSAL